MDDVAIKVEHVSKKFCKSLRKSMFYGVTDIGRNMLMLSSHPERLRKNEFWAVDDVSFEVKKGETLGIIGANGSGKTTMLSMINGIYLPDRGKITIAGRTGALIAVGAGFHPMISGRENIYIEGAIRGLTKKEIDEKLDEIIEFADIGDFIDSPVKFYSSGMMVRLGFAVAIHMEPEVLLIDEVLSVGDLAFQNKSLRRLAELRDKANAVVFVSHNLEHVRNICDRVIILEDGNVVFSGNTHEAILKYHEMSREKRLAAVKKGQAFETYGHVSSGNIVLEDSGMLDESGNKTDKIRIGDDVKVFFEFEVKEDVEELYFSVGILDEKRMLCLWQMSNDGADGTRFQNITKGRYRLIVNYRSPNLVPGIYTPTFAIRNGKTGETYERAGYASSFSIEGNTIPRGIVLSESEWALTPIKDKG
jgi:lipopolysaccharide transport system ATP-binding protein